MGPNTASPKTELCTTASGPKQAAAGLRSRQIAWVLMGLGAAAMADAAAYAEPHRNATRSIAVSHAGLDLMTEDGARQMLDRIEKAAREVCATGLEHGQIAPRALAAFRACTRDAVAAAAVSLNAPAVMAELGAPPALLERLTLAER